MLGRKPRSDKGTKRVERDEVGFSFKLDKMNPTELKIMESIAQWTSQRDERGMPLTVRSWVVALCSGDATPLPVPSQVQLEEVVERLEQVIVQLESGELVPKKGKGAKAKGVISQAYLSNLLQAVRGDED